MLAEVGIDVRQAASLFEILDFDGSGVLEVEEFVEGVMKARGAAKAQDLLAVHCDVWRCEQRVIQHLKSDIGSLRKHVQRLGRKLEMDKMELQEKEEVEARKEAQKELFKGGKPPKQMSNFSM